MSKKVYHFGNLKNSLYVYTIYIGGCWFFVFENENYLLKWLNCVVSNQELKEYLLGKKTISLSLDSIDIFNLDVTDFGKCDKDEKKRLFENFIEEWEMNKYANIEQHKVVLELPKLVRYWGRTKNVSQNN